MKLLPTLLFMRIIQNKFDRVLFFLYLLPV
nr:MAG TPA: hypothetical protein [Caudoviricetes sp.]